MCYYYVKTAKNRKADATCCHKSCIKINKVISSNYKSGNFYVAATYLSTTQYGFVLVQSRITLFVLPQMN